MNDPLCDPETNSCAPAASNDDKNEGNHLISRSCEIIYVGDPMCSWCWGISPDLQLLKKNYQNSLPFRVVVGGLRPGGGDPWDDKMKDFLRHHWEEIEERTGQPFGYELLALPYFDYDTEPACRAVVTARSLAPAKEFDFFEAVQRDFYVHSKDPASVGFYQDICEEFSIDFKSFSSLFQSNLMASETNKDFVLNRDWGVRGYPTILLRKDQNLYRVTNGYATYDQMKGYIDELVGQQQDPTILS